MSSLENIKSSAVSDQRLQRLSRLLENQLQYLESADFQLWIQNKTPRSLHPLLKWTLNHSLNYALDWIRPELHRHGYQIKKLTLSYIESELKLGDKKEIPLSLVVNSLEQSLKLFFSQHIPGQQFELQMTSVQIEKKQKWDDTITLKINFDEKKLDQDLLQLQKHKNFEFENQMNLKIANKKSIDYVAFKVILKLTPLLSFNKKDHNDY